MCRKQWNKYCFHAFHRISFETYVRTNDSVKANTPNTNVRNAKQSAHESPENCRSGLFLSAINKLVAIISLYLFFRASFPDTWSRAFSERWKSKGGGVGRIQCVLVPFHNAFCLSRLAWNRHETKERMKKKIKKERWQRTSTSTDLPSKPNSNLVFLYSIRNARAHKVHVLRRDSNNPLHDNDHKRTI